MKDIKMLADKKRSRLSWHSMVPFFMISSFMVFMLLVSFGTRQASAQNGYGGAGLTGRAISWRSGKVSTQITGLVKSLHVKIGETVRQGDILAVMDTILLKSDMLQAQSELEEARAKASVTKAKIALKRNILTRQNNLRRSIAFRQSRYDEASLALKIAEAEYLATKARVTIQETILKRKQLDIALSVIRAPYDGVIKKLFTQQGAFITPEEPHLLEMIDTNAIEIEVDIAVQDTGHYHTGQAVLFQNGAGKSFRAKIRQLLPVINIRTQTRPVRFTPLDNAVIKKLVIGQEVTLLQKDLP